MHWHTSLVLAVCFFCGTTQALNRCKQKADEGGEFSSAIGSTYGKCITAETAETPAMLEFHGCLIAPDEGGQDASQKLPTGAPKLIVGGTAFECKAAEGSDQEPPVLWHSLPEPNEMSGCQGKLLGKSYDVKDGELWDNEKFVFQCELSAGKLEFRLKPWGCIRELTGKPADRVPVGTAWTLPGDPQGEIGVKYLKQSDLSCMFSPIAGPVKRVEKTFVTRELAYTGCRVTVEGKVRAIKHGSFLRVYSLALQCRVAKDKQDFHLVPWGCAKTDANWEGDKIIPFGKMEPTDKHWRVQSSKDKKFFYNVACTYDKAAGTVAQAIYECEFHDGKEIKKFPIGCVFAVDAKSWRGDDRIGLGYLCRKSEKGSMTPLVLKNDKRILVPEPNCN